MRFSPGHRSWEHQGPRGLEQQWILQGQWHCPGPIEKTSHSFCGTTSILKILLFKVSVLQVAPTLFRSSYKLPPSAPKSIIWQFSTLLGENLGQVIFGTSLKFAKIAKLQLTSHTNSYSCISCMTCVTSMEILSWSFRMIQLSLLSFRFVFHGPLDSPTWSWMWARVTLSLDGADLTTISPLPKPTFASLPQSPGWAFSVLFKGLRTQVPKCQQHVAVKACAYVM